MRGIRLRHAAGSSPEPARPLVEIRPTRIDDAERVRAFVRALSPHSQTHRFFAGLTKPSASLIKTMITRDDRRDALVAVLDEEVIGHIMGYTMDGTIDIGVVVADAWQNAGIGGRLVRALLRRSSAETVTMDVLGDNRLVLSMIRHLWPDASMVVSSGTVEVSARNPFAGGGRGARDQPAVQPFSRSLFRRSC
jgi:GNAT superfamily N-acetyltransferase